MGFEAADYRELLVLPSGWSSRPLGQCIRKIIDYRGKTPPKSPRGVPCLTAANVKGGRVELEGISFISDATYASVTTRGLPKPGDVLLTTEAPVGEVAEFPADRTYHITRRVIAIRADGTHLIGKYLLYALQGGPTKRLLRSRIRGSTVERILKEDITRLPVALPPLPEQRAIAHILGTLDDKIDLNRRMSETLEGIAHAIFKSWFVDFDSVRAKAEGRDAGLPKHLSGLFPGGFDDSVLGRAPAGWEVTHVEEVVDCVKGKSYRSTDLQESATALVTLKSFARGGGYRPDGLKSYTGDFKPEQIVSPGELILACTDVTQAAEVIGRPAIVRSSSRFAQLVASLDVLIVRPRISALTVAFLYCLFRTPEFADHTYAHSTGTTVLHLAKEALPSYRFALPPEELRDAFASVAIPLFERIDIGAGESRTLASLRDALLPRLISGEIRIRDAERIVGRAV
ncbi:MAG: restriction endonuclease subunit S [Candidatus Eisenbacteria sp.]|nr:restriction endonuclease subunit S [Candidatus Eisenbacteria bacterium]